MEQKFTIDHVQSDLLTALLGFHSVWHLRRLSYIMDDITTFMEQHQRCPLILSGSVPEGFFYKSNNDSDVMFCPSHIIGSTEEYSTQEEILHIRLVPSIHPGYYHLKANTQNVRRTKFKDSFVGTKDKHSFMSTFMFKEICKHMGEVSEDMKDISGPAYKCPGGRTIDVVFCIALTDWPEEAKTFFTRSGTRAWPTQSMVDTIRSMACHVVATGHDEDIDDEFRLSFSVVEKYLIRQWTEHQFMAFFILKTLQKQSPFPSIVKSYFIKTTLFWIFEKQSEKFWSQPIICIVDHCLKRLQESFKIRYLRNYFIEENNMIENYSEDQSKEAAQFLSTTRQNLFWNIYKVLSGINIGILKAYVDKSRDEYEYISNIQIMTKAILCSPKIGDDSPYDLIKIKSMFKSEFYQQRVTPKTWKQSSTVFDILKDLHKFRDAPLAVIKVNMSDMSEEISYYCWDLSNLCIGNIYFHLAIKEQLKQHQEECVYNTSDERYNEYMTIVHVKLSRTYNISYAMGLLLSSSYFYKNMISAITLKYKWFLMDSLCRLALCLFLTNNHGAAKYYITKYLNTDDLPESSRYVYIGSRPIWTVFHNQRIDRGLRDLLVKVKEHKIESLINTYVLTVYIMCRITKGSQQQHYKQIYNNKLGPYIQKYVEFIKSYELLKKYVN